MTASKLLRVSFCIESQALGDFVHQYADKVQGLEIAAVVRVAHDKNKPGLTQSRETGKKAREEIVALLAQGPLSYQDIAAKLPHYDAKFVRQLAYNMVAKGVAAKTKKGTLALAANGAAKNGATPTAGH